MRVRALVLSALLVAGCSRPAEPVGRVASTDARAVVAAASDSAAEPEEAAAAAPAAPSPAGGAAQPPTAPMLAYSYDYRIAAPPKGVRALVARHEAACVAAGPAVCQVTSTSVTSEGEGEVRGALALRAEPGWLRRFRDGLSREARDAGGQVLSAGSTSEDLTRQIVDTEAAMRAKTTLRDRLQGLLATRPGKVSELLELEQALAQVQQEIDSTQSELAVMRTRVATSALQIDYQSTGIAGRPAAWRPLADAVGDAGGMLAASLATLLRTVVVAAPWVLVLAGVWFLVRKRLPKRRPKPPKTNPPPDPAA